MGGSRPACGKARVPWRTAGRFNSPQRAVSHPFQATARPNRPKSVIVEQVPSNTAVSGRRRVRGWGRITDRHSSPTHHSSHEPSSAKYVPSAQKKVGAIVGKGVGEHVYLGWG